MIDDAMVKAIVDWMDGEFMIDDKREQFRVELEKVVRRDLPKYAGHRYELYIDYDPNEPLLEALRNAGVDCDGNFFSARGIFRYGKTGVRVRQGKAYVKPGYGKNDMELWPDRDPELKQ